MSFIGNLVDEFTHKHQQNEQGYGGQSYAPQPPSQGNGPPQVPPPWIAEFDSREGRWFFVNRETGERTWEYPQSYGGGYPPQGGYSQQGGYPPQGNYNESEQQPQKSHTGRNVALGAVAGLAGGAALMYGGEKIEDKWDEDKARWDEDKYRMENNFDDRVDDGVQDVENFPDDAARWTGEKVQDVEDIPQDIENKWDNAVDDVEDAPEDAANWVGDKVGDVERFGDGMENAYDDGRDESRYDDDNY